MLEAGHSDHAQIRQQGEASTPWNRHNRTSAEPCYRAPIVCAGYLSNWGHYCFDDIW